MHFLQSHLSGDQLGFAIVMAPLAAFVALGIVVELDRAITQAKSERAGIVVAKVEGR